MSIKFEKIVPGMRLYSLERQRAGSTTMTRLALYEVVIVSVDEAKRTAIASWNGNPPTTWTDRSLIRLCAKRPAAYDRWKNSAIGRMLG